MSVMVTETGMDAYLEGQNNAKKEDEEEFNGQSQGMPSSVVALPTRCVEEGTEMTIERQRTHLCARFYAPVVRKYDAQPRAHEQIRIDVVGVEVDVEPTLRCV